MSLNYSYDEDIIDIMRSVMDNGTGKAETPNEHVLIKLMQLRGTPMTNFKYDQDRVDFHYGQWKVGVANEEERIDVFLTRDVCKDVCEKINRCFALTNYPRGFVEAHPANGGGFVLSVGNRDIQFDRNFKWVGQGTDMAKSWRVEEEGHDPTTTD